MREKSCSYFKNKWFFFLIFRSMSSNIRTSTSLTVVDLPGFQNPATCGRNSGATFEDLCYNYAQEKIQMLYHDLTFTLQQDRYSQVMERDWYLLSSLHRLLSWFYSKNSDVHKQSYMLMMSDPQQYLEIRSSMFIF